MLKNYFVLAYRNLLKNKVSSFINIFGLSVAIACSILAYLFMDTYFSMDSFHEDGGRIFLVENYIERDGSRQLWGDGPFPLGPALEADFPQVEQTVRIEFGGGTVQYGDKVFGERLVFAEPAFLEMFNFPLKYGDPAALYEENTVILSEDIAIKYFGEANPLGEQMLVEMGEDQLQAFTVQGVAEKFPEQASFEFTLLFNFEKLRDRGYDFDDWSKYVDATFVKVRRAEDIDVIAGQLGPYLELQNAASDDWPIVELRFDNLRHLARNSYQVRGDIAGGPHPTATVVLPLIALFLLLLACFNYMNIAVATASRRIKEIGVRKVVGSSKAQLVVQFLSENVLLCLLALVAGVALAHFFILPSFNSFFEGWPRFEISLTENLDLWAFLLVLLVGTALFSGGYPAFYVASFHPAVIFQGKQRLGGQNVFTRGFLAFQFVLAFITMIAGVAFVQNARFQAERDWGYDQEHTLAVDLEETGRFEALANEVRQLSDVLEVAGSRHHVSRANGYAVVEVRGEKMEARYLDVGYAYFDVMKLRLEKGRLFDPDLPGDQNSAIVVNEAFARNQGWDAPLGEQVWYDSTTYSVVGVVADFHYDSFFDPISPLFFRLSAPEAYRYLTVRTRPGAAVQTADAVQAAWKRLYPDVPYDGFFQDEALDYYYVINANITKIFGFTAVMALLISCMGLFGLAAQNVARRMKEMSIRKVLGASVGSLTTLINRRFFVLMLGAAVIATPLSYFAVDALLNSLYEYHVGVNPWPFILAYTLVFLTALLTVATQIRRVAGMNPAEVLRNE